MDKAKCRSCGADIIWCKTELGKSMPLDSQTYIDGNIELRDDGVACYMPEGTAPSAMRYKSHFATCPQSKQWRKKQGP